MNLFRKKRLAVATTVYWVLLAYIISGLGFWFIELQGKNTQMATYEMQQLKKDDPSYEAKYKDIQAESQRKTAQYIGEGSTFLLLILVGAL
ncbi:MAG TPA: two-component sensor histidine kinase, partial [Puia sp.]